MKDRIMFFDTEIERLYLINGLSRSGNHLFIEWLISSFNKGEVYFLNNIYPKSQFSLYNRNKVNTNKLMKDSVATSDGKNESESMDPKNVEKLVTKQEMLDLLKGKTKSIKVLIISIENNFVDILDFFEKRFENAKRVYKVIVLRDILNLMASRFEAEKKVVVELMKKNPNFKWHTYETDSITYGFWVNNYIKSFDRNYIVYNYNKFVLDENYRIDLSKKLDINYKKTQIVQSKFLTGSSFRDNNNPDIHKYFMRWKQYENNKIIKFLLQQKEIIDLLCNDFYFCIKNNKLTIKNANINLKPHIKKQIKKNKK